MYKLTTSVELPPSPPRLAYGQAGLSFGSCFSEYIGTQLQLGGLDLDVNPFGIQYNPLSIAQGLELLLSGRELTQGELVRQGGLYHAWAYHGSFSHPDPAVALAQMNERLERARCQLKRLDFLLLTWGSAYVYRLADAQWGTLGEVVSNCHKFPERTFSRSRVDVAELLAVWRPLLAKLFEMRPQLAIITTLSPVRHLRDGAHGNALSKSTLLLFTEALCGCYPERIHYFPAYEILLDELRDYRFYADDLAHPSPLAQGLIAERFSAWALEATTRQGQAQAHALVRELSHRPLHELGEGQALRLERLAQKLDTFRSRYPQAHVPHFHL